MTYFPTTKSNPVLSFKRFKSESTQKIASIRCAVLTRQKDKQTNKQLYRLCVYSQVIETQRLSQRPVGILWHLLSNRRLQMMPVLGQLRDIEML